MKEKKILSVFFASFFLLSFTIGFTACSDDTPEIDKPDQEKPDEGNGDNGDNEDDYISELKLVSFDKNPEEDFSQVTVKYLLDEHITEAKLTISDSQSIDTTIEGLTDGSIEGYSISGEGEITLPFDNSNPIGNYSVVMVTFIDSEYYNDYRADFYWDGESSDMPSSDELEKNTVAVYYNEEKAIVIAASNISDYVTATINGGQVIVTQSTDVNDTVGEITYILNGESSNGSFVLDGSYKSTVILNGLNLTNQSGAAIDIQNGKRIKVKIADGTFNSLTDGVDGSQKASFYCKGHLEFSGSGSLNVVGNTSHAISAKEYIEIKQSEITITKAVKDGINCAQYFLMESGTLNIKGTGDDGVQCDYKDSENRDKEDTGTITIAGGSIEAVITTDAAKAFKSEGNFLITGGSVTATVSGNGIWDESKQKTKASACISADENIIIDGGILNLTATGTGGKGISADGTYTGNSGSVTILTSGGVVAYVNNTLQQNYTGNLDRLQSDLKSSPKGIKIDGDIEIYDGNYDITTKGYNGEGIESKSNLTIAGGNIKIRAYDDGTNSSNDTYFKGGNLDIISTNIGDAIDSNGNIYVSGGRIQCLATIVPEQGFDAGDGYNIFFTGGEFLAYGPGGNSVPKSSGQSNQAYLALSETVKGGDTVTVSYDDKTILSFEIPLEYTSSGNQGFAGGDSPRSFDDDSFAETRAPGGWGGGGFGGSPLILSCPELVDGSSYTVTIGSTTTTAIAKISN